MGDRANIVIDDGDGRLFLYGHWMGHEAPAILQRALKRNDSWDDPSYLARIVFAEMTKDDINGTSGFGISTQIQDNEHPLLIVHCDTQTVRFENEDGTPSGGAALGFKEYAALPAISWAVAYPSKG